MMSNILNATHLKERGKELKKEISEMVNNRDNFIITPIPSKVKLNQSQYMSLLSQEELQDMVQYSRFEDKVRNSKFKLLYTGKYVLEVEVVETV